MQTLLTAISRNGLKDGKDIGALKPRVLGLDWSGLVVRIDVDEQTIMLNEEERQGRKSRLTLRMVNGRLAIDDTHIIVCPICCSEHTQAMDPGNCSELQSKAYIRLFRIRCSWEVEYFPAKKILHGLPVSA